MHVWPTTPPTSGNYKGINPPTVHLWQNMMIYCDIFTSVLIHTELPSVYKTPTSSTLLNPRSNPRTLSLQGKIPKQTSLESSSYQDIFNNTPFEQRKISLKIVKFKCGMLCLALLQELVLFGPACDRPWRGSVQSLKHRVKSDESAL